MVPLSIIVPIYNKAPYLRACVDSILAQTFQAFELLLINDGSTDDSAAICQLLAASDDRVQVLQQPNAGVSSARNKGLDAARGEFIGFVDADDVIEPQMYAQLLRNARESGAHISVCATRKHLPGGRPPSALVAQPRQLLNRTEAIGSLLEEAFSGSVCDKIYHRSLLRDLRFRGTLYEDVYFNFLALSSSHQVVVDPTPLYTYLVRQSSASMSKFSRRYMDVFSVAKSISEKTRTTVPKLTNQAIRYRFMLNMFLLNLILLTSRSKYSEEYQIVVSDLQGLQSEKNALLLLKPKHAWAYRFFKVSPALYSLVLQLFSALSRSEMRVRT
jgi:glycosyltransferase involved in cell wall biosynthesis